MTDEERLVKLAVEASRQAYCPYSQFPVGAALLAEDGRTFTGCNVENAALGLSMCAERTALFKAVSEGARRFTALAVAGGSAPCSPCGACRQVLFEFAPRLRLVMADRTGQRLRRMELAALLPAAFGPQDLCR
ncbi:MAG: cytidine deaminase [Candidatus Bipolaricaulaceae bacterium]